MEVLLWRTKPYFSLPLWTSRVPVSYGPFSPLPIRASPCESSEKEQSTKLARSSFSIRQHDRKGTRTAQGQTRETWY